MQFIRLALFASSVLGTAYAAKTLQGGASSRPSHWNTFAKRADEMKGESYCADGGQIGPTFGKVIDCISHLQDSKDSVKPWQHEGNNCQEIVCKGKTVIEFCINDPSKIGDTKESDIGNWADQAWTTCYSPNKAKDSKGGPDGQMIYAFKQKFGPFDINIRGNGDC